MVASGGNGSHRLRGRASDADAKFCQQVCQSLGMRCRVGVWRDVKAGASEAAARAARHEFFGREMGKLGAKKLWLAHQQDDIAETMLMRLARGSGTGGLAALLENNLQADGRVKLPAALVPHFGKEYLSFQ